MMYFLICGIAIIAICLIYKTYDNDKIDYRLPRETWASQEYEIYNRQMFLKHSMTAGIILTTAGLIGLLLGW